MKRLFLLLLLAGLVAGCHWPGIDNKKRHPIYQHDPKLRPSFG